VKFLADENVHAQIVRWLRGRGHDVLFAAEDLRGTPDDELLRLARRDGRILITDDKDFGELVFHRRLLTAGVLLVRLEAPSISDRLARLEEVWAIVESQALGKFVVVTDAKVRTRGVFEGP
jgi:predicted nuclease of predicted toxin-antitoxin system